MPIYVHLCGCGNRFEEYKPISEAGKPALCKCGKKAKQIIDTMGYEPWKPFYCETQSKYFDTRESYNNYCKKKGLDGITVGEHRQIQQRADHDRRERRLKAS